MNDSWKEWSKHILHELERLDRVCNDLLVRNERVELQLVALKTKLKIFGALVGAVLSIGGTILLYFLDIF